MSQDTDCVTVTNDNYRIFNLDELRTGRYSFSIRFTQAPPMSNSIMRVVTDIVERDSDLAKHITFTPYSISGTYKASHGHTDTTLAASLASIIEAVTALTTIKH